jgi:serine/threonine-protein kinase RsbW
VSTLIAQLPAPTQTLRPFVARPRADAAAARRAIGLARAFAREHRIQADLADRLAIVLEEWTVNVVEHGAPPVGSRIMLRLERAGGGARLTASDAGAPFDPRTPLFEEPNIERGGGAGLALIRAWTRVRSYRRRGGRNHVVLEIGL